jgi:hypothetical protein
LVLAVVLGLLGTGACRSVVAGLFCDANSRACGGGCLADGLLCSGDGECCSQECGNDGTCAPQMCSQPGCHDVCVEGPPMPLQTCANDPQAACIADVVAVDPYCGECAWDEFCVLDAIAVCSLDCVTPS